MRSESNALNDPDATQVVTRSALPRIPGYEVTRLLGAGGMAQVFLGTDLALKRQVAVKTMNAELGADPQFRERFAHEAQTVAAFRHPNIVTVFAYGEADGRNYIVMEYVPGGTLADRLSTGPCTDDEALRIGRSLARALSHFHEHGIVHRDLKPGNILFTAAGEPVLSDFGIAKSLAVDASRTTTGALIGSPRYMAPEQLLGHPATDRADIYSFALVMLEMLVGEVPKRDVATIRSKRDVAALRRALPAHARRYAAFLGRCLRSDPAERPSATECVTALDELASSGTGRSVWKRLWWIPIIGIAAVAGVLLVTRPGLPAISEFDITPPQSMLYVDGALQADRKLPTMPGTRAVVIVAPGHYGQYYDLDLSTAHRFEFTLARLELPRLADFRTVNDAAATPVQVAYPLFRTWLDLKQRFRRGGAAAIADDLRKLRALADAGDAAAQTTLFFGVDEKFIDGELTSMLPGLKSASDSGFALATFYYALHYRNQHEEDGALDRASLADLRELFALAERQGLEFARENVQAADQLLRDF